MHNEVVEIEINKYINIQEKVHFFLNKYINESTTFNSFLTSHNYDTSKIESIEKYQQLKSKCENNIQVLKRVVVLANEVELSETFRRLLLETIDKKSQYMESFNFPMDYHKYIEGNYQMEIVNESLIPDKLMNQMYDYLTTNIFSFFKQSDNLAYFMEIVLNAVPVFNSNGRNIVVIGANGSGKSTLSREINDLGKNYESIRVIPAQHLLLFHRRKSIHNISSTKTKVVEYQKSYKIYTGKEDYEYRQFIDTYSNELNQIIDYLFSDFFEVSKKNYLNKKQESVGNTKENVSIIEELKEIWEYLLPGKELIIKDIPDISIKDKETKSIYRFNELSDGEKNLFYYIANVLICPDNGYLFIDEPDNFLHPSIVEKLWNILEEKRPNLTFIYITHNINFASSRNNTVFLWNIKFTPPANWKTRVISDFEGLPKELVLELVGTSRPVLFCEGEGSGSIDYRFYNAIFGDSFEIKPVGGHRNVINYTKLYNEDFNLIGQNAIGIIDRDFMCDEYVDNFTSKHSDIYVLPVNEIENLLCSEIILKHLYKKEPVLFNANDYQNFKRKVFTELKKDSIQEKVALSYIKAQLDFTIKSNYVDQGEDFKDLSANFEQFKNIKLKEMYENFINKLKEIVETQDYESFLKNTNLKELLTENYIREFFKAVKGKYSEYVLKYLEHDKELADKIRIEYFKNNMFP